MAVLFVSETVYWRTTRVEDHIVVDKSLAERDFDVDVDVTFPALACRAVRFVSEDAKGVAYDESRIKLALLPAPDSEAPGCRAVGAISVKGLPGVISLAPARAAFGPSGEMAWAAAPDVLRAFNASHAFARLAFGPPFPGQVCPLDGVTSAPTERVAAFTYHVRVVPTVYEPLRGAHVHSRQYATTDFVQEVDVAPAGHAGGHSHAAPGLWIRYDFSPALVRRVEVRRSALQYLTGLCAILGGVFALSGVVDTVLHRVLEAEKSA
jgi:hypothetical protein